MEEICGKCDNWEEDDKKNHTGRCKAFMSLKPYGDDIAPPTPCEPDRKATDNCDNDLFRPRECCQ